MSKFVFVEPSRHALTLAICEKSGLDPSNIRRMVIDLQVEEAAMVYIEMFADDETLNVSLSELGIDLKPEAIA